MSETAVEKSHSRSKSGFSHSSSSILGRPIHRKCNSVEILIKFETAVRELLLCVITDNRIVILLKQISDKILSFADLKFTFCALCTLSLNQWPQAHPLGRALDQPHPLDGGVVLVADAAHVWDVGVLLVATPGRPSLGKRKEG